MPVLARHTTRHAHDVTRWAWWLTTLSHLTRRAVWRQGRVCGSLEVSRSLGDVRLKPLGLSASPDVTSFALSPEQRFVLLACDGLWKAFAGKEAVDFVLERLPRMDARRAELRAQCGDAVALSALTKEAVAALHKERDATNEEGVLRELVHEAVHGRGVKDNVTCVLVRL